MQGLPVIYKIYELVDFLSLWVATFCCPPRSSLYC